MGGFGPVRSVRPGFVHVFACVCRVARFPMGSGGRGVCVWLLSVFDLLVFGSVELDGWREGRGWSCCLAACQREQQARTPTILVLV